MPLRCADKLGSSGLLDVSQVLNRYRGIVIRLTWRLIRSRSKQRRLTIKGHGQAGFPHPRYERVILWLAEGVVTTDGPFVGLSAEEALVRLGEDGWEPIVNFPRMDFGGRTHKAHIRARRPIVPGHPIRKRIVGPR